MTLSLLATGAATVLGGPVAGATVNTLTSSALSSIETNWFGGASRDAARQLRVDWFKTAAKLGSVIACRVIIAAPDNVASNEDPMWQAALADVQQARQDVYISARSQGGYWVTGDNDTSDKMRAAVNAELQQLGVGTLGSIGSVNGSLPSALNPINTGIKAGLQDALNPGGTTTFNFSKGTLLLLGAGAVALVFLYARRK
jgi:hypothetical protein